jgi:hypothetical protein
MHRGVIMSVQIVTTCDVCDSGHIRVGEADRAGSFVACGDCWHASREELAAVKEQLNQSQARISELEVELANCHATNSKGFTAEEIKERYADILRDAPDGQ